ncbi:hypothetical protein [Microbacterium sp. p3-SID131]|uniref:hypothetical protein n=1 Tax=Microbacterium sp. p3-SID131 TaxID=2916215 RepID=UPI0021A4A694|nr:hypothetical protein [Microbacterium sp. p3-SID131]MCT1363922.1 hypothetical protein [Microbacterium sp. p3-SID131]
MSTRARKDRKRAGIPFAKAQKVGTPVEERSFVTGPVFRRHGDEGLHLGTARSPRRIERFIASGGIPRLNPKLSEVTDEARLGLLRRWIERVRGPRGEEQS